MKRQVIISSILGICATALAGAYFCTLQKQSDANAVLIALADLQLGTTKKNEFVDHMKRFSKYKSSEDIFSYKTNVTYRGVGYYVDNLVIGKYSMFPYTSISSSVYFDSNDTAHSWTVIISNEKAIVTLENELEPHPSMVDTLAPHLEGAPWPATRTLHKVNSQDLGRISVSCFTSWFGCDTSKKLLIGGN